MSENKKSNMAMETLTAIFATLLLGAGFSVVCVLLDKLLIV